MNRGICPISLRQYIKERRSNLQDGIVSEDVKDILIILIQNNSDSEVTINKGLVYINYSF